MDIFKGRGSSVRKDGPLSTIGTITWKLEARVRVEVQLLLKISIVAGTGKREQMRPKNRIKARGVVGYLRWIGVGIRILLVAQNKWEVCNIMELRSIGTLPWRKVLLKFQWPNRISKDLGLSVWKSSYFRNALHETL